MSGYLNRVLNLTPQLTLGFDLKNEATFSHFYTSHNEEIISHLKKSVLGAGEKMIYVYSPLSNGLSHLLQACCHFAHEHGRQSVYLPVAHLLSLTPDVLDNLEALHVICLDDVHLIAGKKSWEEAIFNLYNRINDKQGSLIISAKQLPKNLNLYLPDLVSRLNAGIIYQLEALNDSDKINILIQRANTRGISLSEEAAKYLLTHCPRHMGTLFAALDALDKASLSAQRRLTIPFIKTVLQL